MKSQLPTRKPWSDTTISAYIDGELSPRLQVDFETDLLTDKNLRARVHQLRYLSRQLCLSPKDQHVTARLKYAIKLEKAHTPQRLGRWRLMLSASAAALALSATVTLWWGFGFQQPAQLTPNDLYAHYSAASTLASLDAAPLEP